MYKPSFLAVVSNLDKQSPISLVRPLTLIVALLISVQASSQNYLVNGIGAYQEFGEATLIVKLELENPATNPLEAIAVDTNKRLSFRLLKDKSPRLWSRIWIQNLSINNPPATITTQTNDLIAMTQAFKGSLQVGDIVEFERIANDLTIMSVDGVEVADFSTPEFFEFLLSAFIGSVPPSSELKDALLGGADTDSGSDAMVVFDTVAYAAGRPAAIARWIAPAPEPDPEPLVEVAAEEPAPVVEQEDVIEEAATEVPAETEVAVAVEPAPEPEPIVEDVVEEIMAEEDAPIIITAESLLAAQNYQRSVLTKVYQNIVYPPSALRRNREGSLRVAISINENGSLNRVDVTQNARYTNLDEAAVEAVQDAAPFEPLPAGTPEIPMVLEIPVTFQLN